MMLARSDLSNYLNTLLKRGAPNQEASGGVGLLALGKTAAILAAAILAKKNGSTPPISLPPQK